MFLPTWLYCSTLFLFWQRYHSGATLTLPGIAGIVLTIAMAVDANVLINERIREELRNGMSPQTSIKAGYERALADYCGFQRDHLNCDDGVICTG